MKNEKVPKGNPGESKTSVAAEGTSISRNYYKSATFVFIIQAAGVAIGFFYQMLLSNKLGKDGYGAFAVFLAAGAVLSLIPVLGMDSGLIRSVSKEESPSVQKWYFTSSVKTSVVILLALVAVLLPAHNFMQKLFKLQQPMFILLVVWVVFLCFGKILDGFLRGINRTATQSLISVLLANGFKFLFSLLVFLYRRNLEDAVWVLIATEAVLLLPRILLLTRYFRNVQPEKQARGVYRTYLVYCLSLFLYASLSVTMQNVNSLMLNAYLGPGQQSQVGIFRVITSYSNVIMVFATPMITLWPVMSQLFTQKKMDVLKQLYSRSTLAVSMLMVPALIILAVCSQEFIGFFGFKGSMPNTALLMLLLLSANLFDGMIGPAGALLNMTNYSKVSLMNNGLYFALNVILNIVLIPRYGLLGVALAASISLVFINTLNVVQTRRLLGIFPYSKNHLYIIGCGALAYGISWAIKRSMHVSAILSIVLIAAATASVFYGFVFALMHKELKNLAPLIVGMVKRKKE